MTLRIITHIEATCDSCSIDTCELTEDFTEALTEAHIDGWRQFSKRMICSGCIERRACRLFGHKSPTSFDGRPYCDRCYEDVRP